MCVLVRVRVWCACVCGVVLVPCDDRQYCMHPDRATPNTQYINTHHIGGLRQTCDDVGGDRTPRQQLSGVVTSIGTRILNMAAVRAASNEANWLQIISLSMVIAHATLHLRGSSASFLSATCPCGYAHNDTSGRAPCTLRGSWGPRKQNGRSR